MSHINAAKPPSGDLIVCAGGGFAGKAPLAEAGIQFRGEYGGQDAKPWISRGDKALVLPALSDEAIIGNARVTEELILLRPAATTAGSRQQPPDLLRSQ